MAGSGNDTFTMDSNSNMNAGTNVSMGSGNDIAYLWGAFDGYLRMGRGNDLVDILYKVPTGEIRGGLGADTFHFHGRNYVGEMNIVDFEAARDTIEFYGIGSLDDFTTVTQVGDDVILFIATEVTDDASDTGFYLRLGDTDIADLLPAVFVDLYSI